jgi:hypothetical protein
MPLGATGFQISDFETRLSWPGINRIAILEGVDEQRVKGASQ